MRLKKSDDGQQIVDQEGEFEIELKPGFNASTVRGTLKRGEFIMTFYGGDVAGTDPRVFEVFPRQCRPEDVSSQIKELIAEAIILARPILADSNKARRAMRKGAAHGSTR